MRPFLLVNYLLILGAMLEFFLRGNSIERFWIRLDSLRWPKDYEEWD